MSKTLCERKKDLKHDLEAYVQLVCPARFVCAKCGRVANKQKYLCDPEKIETASWREGDDDLILELLPA